MCTNSNKCSNRSNFNEFFFYWYLKIDIDYVNILVIIRTSLNNQVRRILNQKQFTRKPIKKWKNGLKIYSFGLWKWPCGHVPRSAWLQQLCYISQNAWKEMIIPLLFQHCKPKWLDYFAVNFWYSAFSWPQVSLRTEKFSIWLFVVVQFLLLKLCFFFMIAW